jgi:SAM-dependent methyltransferase
MNYVTNQGLKQHPVFASVTDAVSSFTKRRGKQAFLHKQKPNFTLLDVGCGNDSPLFCKAARPDCNYIGLDIGQYNLSDRSRQLMDKFLLAEPSGFADAILTQRGSADAVISAHNLEHCDEPDRVLKALCEALRPGGNLFLAFPCEQSTSFPRRSGTLNFFDDATHHNILRFSTVLEALRQEGMQIEFAAPRYRPPLPAAAGFMLEPLSAVRKQVLPLKLTWAFWGFESIIWAHKPDGK